MRATAFRFACMLALRRPSAFLRGCRADGLRAACPCPPSLGRRSAGDTQFPRNDGTRNRAASWTGKWPSRQPKTCPTADHRMEWRKSQRAPTGATSVEPRLILLLRGSQHHTQGVPEGPQRAGGVGDVSCRPAGNALHIYRINSTIPPPTSAKPMINMSNTSK
jgi:hypothetical protein